MGTVARRNGMAGGCEGRSGLCVLTFHVIGQKLRRDHDITWPEFMRLLDVIASRRLATGAYLDTERLPAGRTLVLTFDDGTADHAEVGEELARRGIAGIFFISAGRHGGRRYVSRSEVRRLVATGHILGCHGYDHTRLDGPMTETDIRREIGDSKRLLEDIAGTQVDYFAPPGGFGFRGMEDVLRRHGYLASRGMDWGFYRPPANQWRIPCLPVTELTLRLGWIAAALHRWEVPLSMRWATAIRQGLPEPIRVGMRHALHRPFRRGA